MRWAPSFLLVFVLVSSLSLDLAAPPAACAQTDSGSDSEARRLYGEARVAYDAGDFETAVRNFRRAYLLSPRYALLYNIGQAELRAGHDALALEAFEAFLRQSPADDEHRGEVEERARMLRGMGVRAASEAEAETAQQAAQVAETSTAGGAQTTGTTEGGSATTEPSTTEPSGGTDTGVSGGTDSDGGTNVAPWIVLGVGGAVLVAGAVLMGVASSDAGRVTNPSGGASWTSLEGTASGAQTMWGVGLALLGVGAAAAVGGLVWALVDPGEERARPSAQLRVTPGGLFLEGVL